MRLVFDHGHASITRFEPLELPSLVVITGENGAGKSHLLQAIQLGAVKGPWTDTNSVRLLTAQDLGSPAEFSGAGEIREAQVSRLESIIQGVKNLSSQPGYETPELIRAASHQILQNNGMSPSMVSALEVRLSKSLTEWSHDEFVRHTPMEFDPGDLFNVQVGDLFSRYNQMITTHRFNRYQESIGARFDSYLTDEEFTSEFNPPPWDLLNSALSSVGLPYRFSAPPGAMVPIHTPPVLKDPETGMELPVSALSSGERTLLSIAMSVYSSSNRAAAIRIPQVVLLDEPDSALHPSMIQSLLTLLEKDLVGGLGINVVVTTHSPTTVALAPEGALFVMQKRSEPRLRQASSKDDALSRLLVGVPTVSVSAEHRRVVIVESPHDERRYTNIVRLLGLNISSERSLVFMAGGGSGIANGSATVVDLVTRLRNNGNVAIWGLVDRDSRISDPHQFVFMDATRYTIENLVLDPLSVGLLLLSDAHPAITAAMDPVGYVNFDSYLHASKLSELVVEKVADELDNPDVERAPSSYVDGHKHAVPRFWSETRGHDLAAHIKRAFPALNRYRDDHALLDAVIDRIWTQRPGIVPKSTADLLSRFLA